MKEIYETSPVEVVIDDTPHKICYQDFVEKLFKQDTFNEMAHHAKGGLCEEAGEISSNIKRHITYGTPLTKVMSNGKTLRTNIVEEMGDLKFYFTVVQILYGITTEEILQHNAEKLGERYAGLVYSDQAAQARADKVNGE